MGANYARISTEGTGIRAPFAGCLRQKRNSPGRHLADTSHSWQPSVSAKRGWAETDHRTLPAFKWALSLPGSRWAAYGKTSLLRSSFRDLLYDARSAASRTGGSRSV